MPENKPERTRLEDLPSRRVALASLREQKGKSEEALDEARKLEGMFHEEVVDLMWEQYLIGKHMLMEARNNEEGRNLPVRVIEGARGYRIMRTSALRAQMYIDEHSVDSKRPRSGRFLGELEMLVGHSDKAAKYFEKSVSMFEKMGESSDRVNALELSGFWAEALILGGKVDEGIGIAVKTFEKYDEGDGLEFKNRDYYTWAVWKSGCAVKAWHALEQKHIDLQGEERDKLVTMLQESEKIVNVPANWGDFSLRKDEITSIKRSLKLD